MEIQQLHLGLPFMEAGKTVGREGSDNQMPLRFVGDTWVELGAEGGIWTADLHLG